MAGPTIDASGITIQSFEEIFAELVAEFKAIYGEDIDLGQNTPDGQRVAIYTKAFHDMQVFGLAIANNFDPDFARGLFQAKIAKLASVFPRAATRSVWDLSVVTTRPLVLPKDYAITDDLGQIWELQADVSLIAGTSPITFNAKNFGRVTGSISSTFTPVTVVLGVVGFTAISEAVPGVDAETDEEFVQKRNRSVENPGFSTTGALNAKLLNVPGVSDALVMENDKDTTDAILSLPAHSVWAVVEGGTIDDIMKVILTNKTAGAGMKGSIEVMVSETLTRPDGSTFVISSPRRFDRPVYQPIYVKMTATRKNPLVEIDMDLIKEKVAAYKFYIGTTLQAGFLYEPAYEAGDTFVLTDMQISTDNITFTDSGLSPTAGGKFTIAITDIDIDEVIP